MTMQLNSTHWQAVTISLLAGLGLGYLIGLAYIRRKNKALPSITSAPPQPSSSSNSDLKTSIDELKHEVELLRSMLEQRLVQLEVEDRINWNLPSRAYTEGTSEFVSAQSDDEDAEERLQDVKGDEEQVKEESENNMPEDFDLQRLDELGKHSFDDLSAGFTLLEEVNKLLAQSPQEPQLLWRKARALVHLSGLHEKDDKEKELHFIDQAVEAAKKSVELDDGLWQCHYWYALAIGSQVRYQSIQKKIVGGYEYKDHLDTAVKLKPDEPMLHHFLGRWYFEVAGVSWLERKAAAALFASPPEATYDEAMEAFMKVENLSPDVYIKNMLMVAKCHLKLGDQTSAIEWLEKADRIRPVNHEDRKSQKEVGDLLFQLSSDSCV